METLRVPIQSRHRAGIWDHVVPAHAEPALPTIHALRAKCIERYGDAPKYLVLGRNAYAKVCAELAIGITDARAFVTKVMDMEVVCVSTRPDMIEVVLSPDREYLMKVKP